MATCKSKLNLVKILTLSLGLLVSQPALAERFSWADWKESKAGNPGSATGNICDISVQYGGDLVGVYGGYWVEYTPKPYTGNSVVSNAPDGGVLVTSHNGTRTITFSKEVTDPVLAILSLGRPKTPSEGDNYTVTYTFNNPFTLLSEGKGAYGDGNCGGGGSALIGEECHGAIQFKGKFSSISWTSASKKDEYWHGVTVGVAGVEISGIKPERSPVTEGTKIHAVLKNPSDVSIQWSIKPAPNYEGKVHASITGEDATATISNVSGAGDMIVEVTSGNCGPKEFTIKIGCEACEDGNGEQCKGEAGSASKVGL